VGLEEGHDLLADGGIMAHIQAAIGEPALQEIRFVILGGDNADGDFGGQLVVRPIEGDRSDGIAVKTALGFLGEPGPKWLSSLPHSHGAGAFRSRLALADLVTLVAFFQQSIPAWIAHHDFRNVRHKQVIQPSGPSFPFSKVTYKFSRSPCINYRMVIAFVSMIDSITTFPASFITMMAIASL